MEMLLIDLAKQLITYLYDSEQTQTEVNEAWSMLHLLHSIKHERKENSND